MILRKIVQSAAAASLFAAGLGSSANAAEPHLTNSTSFRIPFYVEAEEGQQLPGYAVLFGARDGGQMQQLKRVPVSAGSFQFSAPSDGLWDFAIRMTDRAGVPDPADGPLKSEVQVIVDTAAPRLDVELIDGGNGTVYVKWNVPEDCVPGSIQFEYAEGTNGQWKPLQMSPGTSGEATIHTRPGTSVAVRGSVSDRAGNAGNVRREMITSVPVAKPAPQSPQYSAAPAPHLPAVAAPVGQMPFQIQQSTGQRAFPAPAISGPAVGAVEAMNIPQTGAVAPAQPTGVALPNTVQPSAFASQGMAQNPYPAATNAWTDPSRPVTAATPSVQTSIPGQPTVQLVANAVFNVDYAVEDVGPSGVSSVELFVTENGGQKWFRYGNDTDMKSPMLVDVQGEGTFGFAIRVRNGVGFIDTPPQPGDAPEIVVTVDQTAPVTQLAVPEVRIQSNPLVHLEWNVQDVQSTNVRLEWATSTSGPWIPVFDWQQDPGRIDWPIQANSPHSVHFRLLARDAAGNIGSSQTSQPVLIDLKRPKARMIGVQPAARSIGY